MPISTETCPGDARARPIPDIGEVGALDDSNPSHRDEADLGQPSVGDRAAYDDMAGISPRQLYAQGTAAGISGRGVEVLCGLAQLWMLTRILGPVGYGRIILALTIVQIATLVCACGLERLILFRLSRDTAPPGQLTGHALAGTALAWGLVVACGLGVAIWAAAPGFAAAFNDPSLVFFLRGLSGLVPLQLAICLQAAWHQARQRLPESQLVGRTGPEVVAATLLAGVWLGGGGAVAVVAAIVASRALVAGLWWVRHPLRPARGEMRSSDALFALKTSANGLVFQGLRYSDLIMVGLFMSPESVGLYAVVSRLAMLANLGRSMLAPVFEPRIGFLLRRDQPGALAGEYHHVRILALLVALGLAVPLIGFNTTILHWFGYEAGYPVLLLLIGGGIGAAWWFLIRGGDEKDGAVAQSGTTIRQGPAPLENPVFFQAGTFIVNLADGRRYLKTNVELMLNEELAKTYLENRLSVVKDLIIAELQTLSTEQLRDPKERVLLKERLKGRIETLFPLPRDVKWDDPKPIKKVLFTEFYLQ